MWSIAATCSYLDGSSSVAKGRCVLQRATPAHSGAFQNRAEEGKVKVGPERPCRCPLAGSNSVTVYLRCKSRAELLH